MKRYDLKNKGGSWVLEGQGAQRASINFGDGTKAEAVKGSAEFAKRQPVPVSVLIHKENGAYQEERTYPKSADPTRSPG